MSEQRLVWFLLFSDCSPLPMDPVQFSLLYCNLCNSYFILFYLNIPHYLSNKKKQNWYFVWFGKEQNLLVSTDNTPVTWAYKFRCNHKEGTVFHFNGVAGLSLKTCISKMKREATLLIHRLIKAQIQLLFLFQSNSEDSHQSLGFINHVYTTE